MDEVEKKLREAMTAEEKTLREAMDVLHAARTSTKSDAETVRIADDAFRSVNQYVLQAFGTI